VTEGQGVEEPIATLPGVSRWSVDRIGERAREARELGIPASPCSRTRRRAAQRGCARGAQSRQLICRAVRRPKAAAPEVGVLTDVALDPYTAHGHDGIVDLPAMSQRRDRSGSWRPGAGPGRGRRDIVARPT
jgi:porphobilinogen synthase